MSEEHDHHFDSFGFEEQFDDAGLFLPVEPTVFDEARLAFRRLPLSERNPNEYDTCNKKAKSLLEAALAQDVPLNFDKAFAYISQFRDTFLHPLVGKVMHSDTPLSDMPPPAFFGLTESLDAILTFGEADDRLSAARLVTEMEGSKPYWTDSFQKLPSWQGNLGLSGEMTSNTRACAESVVHRYFTTEDPQVQAGMVDHILNTMRTMDV
ncbi:MAG TPA: hypothetical protein VLG16_04745 [Candidatus Saccharimonadales bacterium]|nr:hypothetical protein [Candidatus Saccharimonadales bacterium]